MCFILQEIGNYTTNRYHKATEQGRNIFSAVCYIVMYAALPYMLTDEKKILKSHTDVAKNIEVLINALVKKSTNNGLIQK